MLSFAASFAAWFASTAGPAFLGLLLITSLRQWVPSRYLAAFALGIFLWFFVDTIGGAALLDVNAGFGGGIPQVAVVLLFAVGTIFFIAFDKGLFSTEAKVRGAIAVSAFAAVAVGIHGFGEGTAFGSTAASTPSTSLLDAFGGASAGVAYALHKAFEPMMVGAIYAASMEGKAENASRWLRDLVLLTFLFTIPSLIGAITGYFINYDASYFFALGTGTSVFVLLSLTKLLGGTEAKGGNESFKLALALVLGFIAIYVAALLHS